MPIPDCPDWDVVVYFKYHPISTADPFLCDHLPLLSEPNSFSVSPNVDWQPDARHSSFGQSTLRFSGLDKRHLLFAHVVPAVEGANTVKCETDTVYVYKCECGLQLWANGGVATDSCFPCSCIFKHMLLLVYTVSCLLLQTLGSMQHPHQRCIKPGFHALLIFVEQIHPSVAGSAQLSTWNN